jgi:hypothetical protein
MTVSLLIEVPEELHDSLKTFMAHRPDYDQDRAFTAGLSLFLMQHRTELGHNGSQRKAARSFLNAVFGRRGEA